MTDLRCVVDSNVLISAALSPTGKPRRVVDLIASSGTFVATSATFHEFETRLRRPRFSRYFSNDEVRDGFIHRIHALSEFVLVANPIMVCSDRDDDKFLEAAIDGNADYLITGNLKDFPPSPFQGVQILAPAEFLEVVLR